jgi:hypothetical protein
MFELADRLVMERYQEPRPVSTQPPSKYKNLESSDMGYQAYESNISKKGNFVRLLATTCASITEEFDLLVMCREL